jgi:hypothetical protein
MFAFFCCYIFLFAFFFCQTFLLVFFLLGLLVVLGLLELQGLDAGVPLHSHTKKQEHTQTKRKQRQHASTIPTHTQANHTKKERSPYYSNKPIPKQQAPATSPNYSKAYKERKKSNPLQQRHTKKEQQTGSTPR